MEKTEHVLDKYQTIMMPFLISKMEEIQMLGYEQATIDDIWTCLKKRKWRKKADQKSVHEIVNDIMTLKVSEFMTYISIESQVTGSIFDEEGLDDLKKLLGK
ncbi:hypothetical protein EJF36_14480 [Bacillus sp. HMF5848]|uniref:post-transcriptional regulator n=1 Tax=Bacillus sp. HMF5848 TaxID=2495421 RepID=UPI000F7ACE15|nr:post-transcriptional regulator [Bacillus sp. HMF5848]RSK27990.1 hypothetical protein EJF36_14480 [Bacillus sp. HMF5848]